MTITSLQNPQIKAARKLSSRKARYAAGQLLVEGVRLLADARQSGVRPVVVFYEPPAVASNLPAAQLLAAFEGDGCTCLPCSPQVFATLAETVTPQGIAAVLPLPARPLPAELTLVLVLDAVRDPGNAGTLLRSAEAAGADLVIFGPDTVDPFNDKVVRAGMGAHFRLPLRVAATFAAVEQLAGAHLPYFLADAAGELAYDAVDWQQPAALIVGGESGGASTAAHAIAQLIQIPMLGRVESLNAGVAGSVILFEAARQRRRPTRA
jgi:TrmH family RNA methyltransferase